jgi:hypothetical protein
MDAKMEGWFANLLNCTSFIINCKCVDARFEIPEKFQSKFRFRAIFRDFWSRSCRNHFFGHRFFRTF